MGWSTWRSPAPAVDWMVREGVAEIPIEERDGRVVTHVQRWPGVGAIGAVHVKPEGSSGGNPARDVTPNRLGAGLIAERSVCVPSGEGLAGLSPELARAEEKDRPMPGCGRT